MAHVPLLTVAAPTLPALKPRKPLPFATTPPVTERPPVPELPTTRLLVPVLPMVNRPLAAVIDRSNWAVPEVSPVRVNVPVLVSANAPLPEIVLLMVRAVV